MFFIKSEKKTLYHHSFLHTEHKERNFVIHVCFETSKIYWIRCENNWSTRHTHKHYSMRTHTHTHSDISTYNCTNEHEQMHKILPMPARTNQNITFQLGRRYGIPSTSLFSRFTLCTYTFSPFRLLLRVSVLFYFSVSWDRSERLLWKQ